jgi:hypothetical protein
VSRSSLFSLIAVAGLTFEAGEKKKDKKDYTRLHVDAKTLDAQLVCPESTSKEDNSAIITDDKEAQKTPGRTVEPLHYWNKEQHRVLAINF